MDNFLWYCVWLGSHSCLVNHAMYLIRLGEGGTPRELFAKLSCVNLSHRQISAGGSSFMLLSDMSRKAILSNSHISVGNASNLLLLKSTDWSELFQCFLKPIGNDSSKFSDKSSSIWKKLYNLILVKVNWWFSRVGRARAPENLPFDFRWRLICANCGRERCSKVGCQVYCRISLELPIVYISKLKFQIYERPLRSSGERSNRREKYLRIFAISALQRFRNNTHDWWDIWYCF